MLARIATAGFIVFSFAACEKNSDLTHLDSTQFDTPVNSGCDGRSFVPARFLQRNQSKIEVFDAESPRVDRYSYLYDTSSINSVAIDRRNHKQQVAFYFFEPAEIQEHVLLHGGIEVKFDLCSEELVSITEVRTES